MSIFKETLPKFVIDQLSIREEIVKAGNDVTPDPVTGKMPLPRTGNPKVKLKGSEKEIRIDSSAFFTNAISKQCVLRMSSGVDVKENAFPNEPSGVELAQRYVLEGGIPKEERVTIKAGTETVDGVERDLFKEVVIPRGGFARGKGSTYGDSRIRSSAKDGFGILPMPGIIDAEIRTKTAYGSLRDAKINFVCHSRDQLEILELLYLRPGYPVLLEWGWLPYIGNDGKRENYFPYMNEWWEKSSTMDQINETIIRRKKASGGNYDAMNGIVKNFQINARADGGFNCVCELVSLGEVLEGLKSKASEKDTINYRNSGEAAPIDVLLKYLIILQQVANGTDIPPAFEPDLVRIIEEIIIPGEDDVSDEAKEQSQSETTPVDEKIDEEGTETSTSADPIISDNVNAGEENEDNEVTNIQFQDVVLTDEVTGEVVDINTLTPDEYQYFMQFGTLEGSGASTVDRAPNQSTPGGGYDQEVKTEQFKRERENPPPKKRQAGQYDINSIFRPFIISKTDVLYSNTFINRSDLGSNFGGVTWDLVAEIFNHFVFPLIKEASKKNKKEIINSKGEDVNIKKEEKETLCSFTYYKDNTNRYLEYTKQTFPVGFKLTYDQELPELLGGENGNDVNSNFLLGSSLDKSVCLLPHQFARANDVDEGAGLLGVSEAEISKFSIGKIFLNIDHLLNTYDAMFYDKEGVTDQFNFLDYFKKIWQQDINEACANTHNFVIGVDPQRNNRYRIIDYDVQTIDVETPIIKKSDGTSTPAVFSGIRAKDVFEFKIQSNESIVRDFTFNTSIPANMASIISIAAGAPNDVSALDEVSFAAFNQNIRSRFTIIENTRTKEDYEKEFRNEVNDLRLAMKNLLNYLSNMLGDQSFNEDKDTNAGPSLAGAKDIVRNLESLIFNVTSRDYSGDNPTFKRDKVTNPSKSAVIPLRFNARMDGISGMVIGNVFKVDKTRLPKGYQREDIAFIITTEKQNITAGQDWTTDITGQLMLLDLEKERVELDGKEAPISPISIQLVDLTAEQQARIDELNITPGVKEIFTDFVLEVEETTEYNILIDNSYRSISKQVELIKRWLDNDPAIVTRPATPGRSLHQYGLALDVNPIHKETGKIIRSDDLNEVWLETRIPEIAARHGLRWGGNFGKYDSNDNIIPEKDRKTIDRIHFDLPQIPGSSYSHPSLRQYLIPFASTKSDKLFKRTIPDFIFTGKNDYDGMKFPAGALAILKEVEGNMIDFRDFSVEELNNSRASGFSATLEEEVEQNVTEGLIVPNTGVDDEIHIDQLLLNNRPQGLDR